MVTLFLVLLVVLALVADFAARHLADDALASHVRANTHASSVHASIGGWPFLYHVFGKGSVPDVDVQLSEVPAGPDLTLQSVDVDLDQVAIDRHQLWADRKVALTSIQQGTATVEVSAPELSAVTGRTVTITPSGQLAVDVAGSAVTVVPTIAPGDILQLRVTGLPLISVDLAAQNTIVPECQLSVTVTVTGVTASCTMSPVPPAVIATISS
jgi:hypothetical protein